MIRVNRVFLILLAASIALLALMGGTFAYYLFCFNLSLFLFSLFYILLVKRFLKVEIENDRNIFTVGEENDIITKVNCLLPIPYITIKQESEIFARRLRTSETCSITLTENRWITNRALFKRRGHYELGRLSLEAVDFFRITRLNKVVKTAKRLKVYPKVYKIESLGMMGRDIFQEVINKNSNNVNNYTIRDLRNYREGDSLKRIHWKASAKNNKLLVKNYDNIAGRGFSLFIDMNKKSLTLDEDGAIEEQTIDYLCSLVNFLVKNSVTVKIFLNTYHGTALEISRIEDFYSFLEQIIEQDSDGEVEFSEFIHKHIYLLDTMNMVGIITPLVNEHLKDNILALKDGGYSTTLFYTVDDEYSNRHINDLKHHNIPAFHSRDLLSE